jgi:hypothetical protein
MVGNWQIYQDGQNMNDEQRRKSLEITKLRLLLWEQIPENIEFEVLLKALSGMLRTVIYDLYAEDEHE